MQTNERGLLDLVFSIETSPTTTARTGSSPIFFSIRKMRTLSGSMVTSLIAGAPSFSEMSPAARQASTSGASGLEDFCCSCACASAPTLTNIAAETNVFKSI